MKTFLIKTKEIKSPQVISLYLAYFFGVTLLKVSSGVIDIYYLESLMIVTGAGSVALFLYLRADRVRSHKKPKDISSFSALLITWFSYGILISGFYEEWSKFPYGFSASAGLKGLSHDAAFHSALTVGIAKNFYPSLLLNDESWFRYQPLSHYVFAVGHKLIGSQQSWYAVITSLQMWIAPLILVFASRCIKQTISDVFRQVISLDVCYVAALLLIFIGVSVEFRALTFRSETQTLAIALFFALFALLLTSVNSQGNTYRRDIAYIWSLLCALVLAKSAAVLFCAGFMLGSTLFDWRTKIFKRFPFVIHSAGSVFLLVCMWAVLNPFQSRAVELFHFADSCSKLYQYFENSVFLMAFAILFLWVGSVFRHWLCNWYLKRVIPGLLTGSGLVVAASVFLRIEGCSFVYIGLQMYWAALLLITLVFVNSTLRNRRLWRVLTLSLPLCVVGYTAHTVLPKVERVGNQLTKYADAVDVGSYGPIVSFSPKPVEEFDSFYSWEKSRDNGPKKYRIKCKVKPLIYTVIYERNADISQASCGYPGVE